MFTGRAQSADMPDHRHLLLYVMAALAWAVATTAQEVPWPPCSPRLDGQALCGNGSVCSCRYDPGGSLTGRVAEWRWSCDILQMCGGPAPAGAPPTPLPPGLSLAPSLQVP